MSALIGGGAISLAVSATAALAAGDPQSGAALAQRWCASCHAGATAGSASDTAPPLREIAKKRDRTPEWWRTWLSDPHPPMPNPGLSRQQIEDVIAYLQRLQTE
jgi:mono/diheme cytochrome c family protein